MEKRSPLFISWMALLSIGLLIGLYAVVRVILTGHAELANTTSRIPWGIQVSTYIFLALTSTGCSFVYCMASAGGVKGLQPIVPRALLLALLTILGGFVSLTLEIGRFERLPLGFALSPNLTSPMWWMGFFYTLYILFLVLEIIALKMGSARLMKVFGIAIILTAVSGHSTLGGVFGVLEARSYGFGALTPIYFLIMAFLGGAALITLTTTVTVWAKGGDEGLQEALTRLRKVFKIAIAAVFIMSVWRYIIGVWVMNPSYDLFEMGWSKFWWFSVLLGMAVPLVLVAFSKGNGALALASVIVLVTQFYDREALIVGIQKIPVFAGVWEPAVLPYTPSFIEILLVVLAMSFIGFIYTLAEKKGLLEDSGH